MMRFEALDDVRSLIRDRVEENVTLEYKREIGDRRLREDVCAFANTEGGTIICGVVERGRIPVDFNWLSGTGTEEQIQNIVKATIHPIVEGIEIRPLPNPDNNEEAIFVVELPRSFQGPHMVHNKYYSRRGSVSSPMEDIEVRAAMFSAGRATALRNEVSQNAELARRTCELIDQVYGKPPEKRQPMALVPLHTDAWRSVIATGLLYSLDGELVEHLLEAYRLIHELNSLMAWVNEADKAEPLVVYTPADPSSARGGVYLPSILQNRLTRLYGSLEGIATMLLR